VTSGSTGPRSRHRGTTNAGDAHVYFEYWPTGHPESVFATIGTFSGTVTCLRVEGNRATVGAVGSNNGGPARALFEVVDNNATRIGTGDQVDWTETPGSAPPDCSTGSFATLRSLYYGTVLVYDAPQ
jgi:hypothetical protein